MAKKKFQSPLRVGNQVFIRTVTNYITGKIESLSTDEVLLSSAAWVASTGRFYNALKSGVLDEVEPFIGVVSIGRGAIVDVCDWSHTLPGEQK